MRIVKDKRGVMWKYLLAMILGVVLIVMMVWVLYMGNKTNWKFIQDLPVNYTGSDRVIELSAEELEALDCKKVGRIGGDGYLIIGDVRSNIYLGESGKLWLNEKWGLFNPLGTDEEIGKVENGVMSFDKVWLQDLKNLRIEDEPTEGIPSEKEFDLLNGASMPVGNVICRDADEVEAYDEEEDCKKSIGSCSVFSGECRDDLTNEEVKEVNEILDPNDEFEDITVGCIDNEISFGKMNCGLRKSCCVEKGESKLINSELQIADFSFYRGMHPRNLEGDKVALVDRGNSLEAVIGTTYNFRYEILNNLGETNGYCYIIRSDKRIEEVGYVKKGDKIIPGILEWNPTSETSFELIVWASDDDSILNVFKRINIIPKKIYGADDVADDEFKLKASNSKPRDFFYITLTDFFDFDYYSERRSVKRFKIINLGKKGVFSSEISFEIQGYYEGNSRWGWKYIDCNGLPGIGYIGLSDLKDSLTETLTKNKCNINND